MAHSRPLSPHVEMRTFGSVKLTCYTASGYFIQQTSRTFKAFAGERNAERGLRCYVL